MRGAAAGVILAFLVPGALAAEGTQLRLNELDSKGIVTGALQQTAKRLDLPTDELAPGAVVFDPDEGTLRWWPYFAGKTFLIEAWLGAEEGKPVATFSAKAGFDVRAAVFEAAAIDGRATLRVSSNEARSDDPWSDGASRSTALEVETIPGSMEEVLAAARELKNTEATAERIAALGAILKEGATEESAAAYLALDVFPLVLDLVEEDLQPLFHASHHVAYPILWDIFSQWPPRGEETTDSCFDEHGRLHEITCSSGHGPAVCNSAVAPDGQGYVCSGITQQCENWFAYSCYCSAWGPAPCDPRDELETLPPPI